MFSPKLRRESTRNPSSSQSSSSILLVDDESEVVLALQDFLHEEGYHVDVARTGTDALERITEGSYDAVLLDIRLPDIEGLLVLERMAKSVPRFPAIILTGGMTSDFHDRTHNGRQAVVPHHDSVCSPTIKTLIRQALHAHNLAKEMRQVSEVVQGCSQSFHEVFQTASDAIVLANHQGQIVSWNPAAESLFGYSAKEIFEQPFSRILPFRYWDVHARGMKHLQKTGEDEVLGTTLSLHGLRKNGEEFPIELSLNSWKNGPHPSYSGFIRDLSYRESLGGMEKVAV